MSRLTKELQEEAVQELRALCPPGKRVYTSLVRVSASGMNHKIRAMIVVPARYPARYPDGGPDTHEIRDITGLVANALCENRDRDGNLSVNGCGMDMGFDTVYTLSRVLYPDGFECTGERCPANDHFNGDRDYTPHRHTNGGCALNHERTR